MYWIAVRVVTITVYYWFVVVL